MFKKTSKLKNLDIVRYLIDDVGTIVEEDHKLLGCIGTVKNLVKKSDEGENVRVTCRFCGLEVHWAEGSDKYTYGSYLLGWAGADGDASSQDQLRFVSTFQSDIDSSGEYLSTLSNRRTLIFLGMQVKDAYEARPRKAPANLVSGQGTTIDYSCKADGSFGSESYN